MIKFAKFLMTKGYKPYRHKGGKIVPEREDRLDFYSSMDHNIYLHLIKNEDFDNERITLGLSEYGKPPTLVFPRPRIKMEKKTEEGIIVYRSEEDDDMNRCLQTESFEDIYEAMFDRSKVFCYKKD